MDRIKPLGWPAYLTIALMIVLPLLDALFTVWPLRVADVGWRFGAVGIFSRVLLTPMLGLVLAYALALVLEQRVGQWIVAGLAALATAALLTATGFFMLDALQTRAQVRPQMLSAFDLASTVALAKLAAFTIVSLILYFVAWRSASRLGTERRMARPPKQMIVAAGSSRGDASGGVPA